MDERFDVAVVGDGVAGLTAALFAARHGRRTVVLGGLGGGELLNVEALEDFPGLAAPVSGFEFCPALVGQAMDAGAAVRLTEVSGIEPAGKAFTVRTAEGPISARAVIVASGAVPRPLGVPGEAALAGRGVSHCASCDGPIFRDRV